MSSPRGPGQRAGLTRERVLAAAAELLDDGGADRLSMRSLAARLGVTPNALYSHVSSKEALVDDLLDDVLAAVETPASAEDDPIAGLNALMTSSYRVLLAHGDLVALYLVRQGARGPNAQHLGEVTLELLERAGVTGSPAQEALHVLIVYTIGSAAFAATTTPTGGVPPRGPVENHADRFDHGLRWLLAGITQAGPLIPA